VVQQRKQILSIVTAVVFGLSLGWLLPAQTPAPAAKGPQWKDTAEYDMYQNYNKGKDLKGKEEALNKWKQGYPDSEFAGQREEEYFTLYLQFKENRKAFDKAKELRAKNPNHFFATTNGILSLIYVLGTPPAAADLAYAEETAKYVLDNLDAFLGPANKPANVNDQQWTALKPNIQNAAMRVTAWVWVQRKGSDARAEVELTKYLQLDPTQAQFSSFLGAAQLAQAKATPAKGVTALYHYARAATYDGPNALPAAERQRLLTFVTDTYVKYHGSKDGLDPILVRAKTNAFPATDFAIKSTSDLANDELAKDEEWKKAHPDLAVWRDTVKGPLTAPDGAAFFEGNFKGAGVPGGFNGVERFKGTIISMEPATRPKKVVVAVFDSKVADATLEFEDPLPGDMPVGSVIEFNGVGKAFQKEPFMVTFDVDAEKDLKGWTGENPKGTPKGPAKGGGTKGGKAAPKGKQ